MKLLLDRGLDVNYREKGNTYAMHWVAAQGNVEVVRLLADGWASCWEGCNDDAHRAVVDFLISRGARHHIFSAVAMNLAGEVRRIVAADPAALNQRQMDLAAAAALRDWDTASALIAANRTLIDRGGALHLLSKRGDATAVKWLLEHGANPNSLWPHWDAEVTPLHMAAMEGHAEVAQLLSDAGADSAIRDSKHDSAALGWAEFFKNTEMLPLLRRAARQPE